MAQRTCETDGCERKHAARGLCSMHWKREHGTPKRYLIACETCGTSHYSARPNGKFCSDACKGRAYRNSRTLVPTDGGFCLLPPEHFVMRLLSKAEPVRARPCLTTFVAGECDWCGATFCALTANGSARYCSARCRRTAAKSKRARNQGQFCISPVVRRSIYERDEWVCQLCCEPVDPRLAGTSHDWAPSLDHIECQSWSLIPDHSPTNLRLAHRWCNAVRGDGQYHADLFISPAA